MKARIKGSWLRTRHRVSSGRDRVLFAKRASNCRNTASITNVIRKYPEATTISGVYVIAVSDRMTVV
jgi:hypothetical protein